ncbi:MAG: ribonuclease H-like domain-containing protein [Bacillota bacterium]|nr:ribonuclease H-like domain-containing protein [Bacillota bacterium]
MKVILIQETALSNIVLPSYLTNKNWLLFDIETTGFDRKNTKVILIGLIYPVNGEIRVKQIFAESFRDEKFLLLEFLKDLRDKDTYISFNGNNFDIPYLNARYSYNDINYVISKIKSFDIYPYFKDNKALFKIPDAKLKTIEKFLEIEREDTIDGKESIYLYYKYLKNKNDDDLNKILLHNKDDIINLLHLTIKTISMDQRVLSYGPKIIELDSDKIYVSDITYLDELLHISLHSEFFSSSYHIIKPIFKMDTLSKNKFIQLPILIFYNDFKKYIFVDTNKLFNIDFDQLTSEEKHCYLIASNDNYKFDNLSKIIQNKIDIP